jgi:membrane-associated protease RseP (regulator of RpoE activity)
MVNFPETSAIFAVLLAAFGILAWGFYRAKPYGKSGILAWLQSVILMTPWVIFLGLFALGIYLNLATILLLLVGSVVAYIWLGSRLRSSKQDILLKEKKVEQSTSPLPNPGALDNAVLSESIPIPEEDLKKLQSIFGIDTFFTTQTIPYQEGAIFRGNLRGEADVVQPCLAERLEAHFGNKYRLFLVEGVEAKPVVIVLPSSNDPQPMTLGQKNLALVLFIATIVTTLEAGGILLGFDLFSNWPRYLEPLPLSLGLWSILIAHEMGHHLIARRYNIRLSLPFFLPTWQIGSFGAVTRFESLIPHRSALFDIALAGPACGGLVSFILLILGLILSHPGSLFQVPSQFFQGSILVGALAKIVLGDALQNPLVDVHPITIVGWLGLVITALNLMPAGQLDGGRIIQAVYGRKIARRTTLATLIILGIVTLVNPSNPIPLYWAVVIIFLQRDLERPSLNELSEPDDARAAWGLLALFLMLVTLIPLSPTLAGNLGIGG